MDKHPGQAGAVVADAFTETSGELVSAKRDETDPARVVTSDPREGIEARVAVDSGSTVVWLPLANNAPDEVADVERVNHYPLYELGKTLRRLSDIIDSEEIHTRRLYMPFRSSLSALDNLLGGTPFPLGISKTAASDLRSAIQWEYTAKFTTVDENGKRVTQYPDGEHVSHNWEFSRISRSLAKFETIFSTEMSELSTYFVPQRGIYSTAALIDFADQSFPTEIYGHVPEKAKDDWKAAGRCLAFNLLSATGFHVARAVEATLEVYYQTFTGASDTLNGWSDYIKALNGVLTSGAAPAPTEKTISELDQMRKDYRNPLVHPRVTLSEADARMLFDNGESLIIAMASEIKDARQAGGIQGALAVVGGSSLDDEIPF